MDRMKNRTFRRRREGGMAYLETIIALPVVVLLLLGLADFSFAFQDFLAANHAAEVGVRTASLSQGNDCTLDGAGDNLVRTRGQQAAAQAMAKAGVIPDDPASINTYASSVVVTRALPDNLRLCQAGMLEIEIPYDLDLAMIRDFLGLIPTGNQTGVFDPKELTVRAVAQNENDR